MTLLPLVEAIAYGDAFEVCRRLAPLGHVVFFDSAERSTPLGRYSFVAADPLAWIERPAGTLAPFDEVRRLLASLVASKRTDLPPFQGGIAGLFGYDLNRSLERVAPPLHDEFAVPALAVGVYDVVISFDHFERKAWIVSQGWPEVDGHSRERRARERLERFKQQLSSDISGAAKPQATFVELAQQCETRFGGVTSCLSEAKYLAAVQRAVDYIHAGDVFQVNLAQRLVHRATTPSLDLYARLRQANPAPMAGYFDLGTYQICSSSPERLLSCVDDRLETRPIKGTRARTARPEADLFAADELQASDKDRAENIMIVDLLRNDLSRVADPDTVRVTKLCGLERYAYVQHLVSVVEARLRAGRTAVDALEATFPGGSITGAPKVRAMEIIAELEPVARGAYCGALAYIGADGSLDSSILIRTITAGGGWWQFSVGGGIVADSNPRSEYEETWHKALGMLRGIGAVS